MKIYETSTLDPGGHLPRLDVTWFLPLHLPRIASDATSCKTVRTV